MSEIIEWAETLTIFNWISLIAITFASVSVVNAILSLRSRYLDWRSGKSKKAFRDRLIEQQEVSKKVVAYLGNPQDYFHKAVLWIFKLLVLFLFVALAFVFAAISIVTHILTPYIPLICLILCLFLLSKGITRIAVNFELIRYVASPSAMINEIAEHLDRGVEHKLIPQREGKAIVETLSKSGLLSPDEIAEFNQRVSSGLIPDKN